MVLVLFRPIAFHGDHLRSSYISFRFDLVRLWKKRGTWFFFSGTSLLFASLITVECTQMWTSSRGRNGITNLAGKYPVLLPHSPWIRKTTKMRRRTFLKYFNYFYAIIVINDVNNRFIESVFQLTLTIHQLSSLSSVRQILSPSLRHRKDGSDANSENKLVLPEKQKLETL